MGLYWHDIFPSTAPYAIDEGATSVVQTQGNATSNSTHGDGLAFLGLEECKYSAVSKLHS